MKSRLIKNLPVVLGILIGCLFGVALGWSSPEPVSRNYLIKARQYAYEPSNLEVNKGDTLNIKLVSLDVVHGFYVEGYDVDAKVYSNQQKFFFRRPSQNEDWQEVDEIQIIADKTGKFRFRCSNTCGSMHPFMQGELIVQPNTTFHAGVGGMAGLFLGMMFMLVQKMKKSSINMIKNNDTETKV